MSSSVRRWRPAVSLAASQGGMKSTARQIDLEVCFASTATFMIEIVSLDYIKNNIKDCKKIDIALFL